VVAETLGLFFLPTVIGGVVGFKTNNAFATSLRSFLLFPHVSCSNDKRADNEAALLKYRDVGILICRPSRQKSGDSQALSLDTFFGPVKKVSRLPAGTGEVDLRVAAFSQSQTKIKTDGLRPAQPIDLQTNPENSPLATYKHSCMFASNVFC